MKKILILGTKGMAGHMLINYLKLSENYSIRQIARNEQTQSDIYNIDVTNTIELERVLKDFRPDVVINCIGLLNKDAENNPDKAIIVNSYIPHFLAKVTSSYGGRLIHISTDCVFSGRRGDYSETDLKDGEGFYAQSKALGEVYYGNNLTIRTSIIGPELKANGIGLFHWFMTNKSEEVKGFVNAYWSGVTTLQLSCAIKHAIENDTINGLIHLTNGEKINKYDLLLLFNEVFNKKISIMPNYDYRVDKSLKKGQLTYLLGNVPDYKQMIIDLKLWMDKNKSMYSNNYIY